MAAAMPAAIGSASWRACGWSNAENRPDAGHLRPAADETRPPMRRALGAEESPAGRRSRGVDRPRGRSKPGLRSAQQRQHLLRQLVGLGDHGGAGLLQHLGARQVGGFRGEVGVLDAAARGRRGSRWSTAGSRSSTRSGSASRRGRRGWLLTVASAASTEAERGVGAGRRWRCRRRRARRCRWRRRRLRARSGRASKATLPVMPDGRDVGDVDRAAGRSPRRRGRSRASWSAPVMVPSVEASRRCCGRRRRSGVSARAGVAWRRRRWRPTAR